MNEDEPTYLPDITPEPVELKADIDRFEEDEVGLDPLSFDGLEAHKPRVKTKLTTRQATLQYGAKNSDHLVAQEKTKAALANREIIRRLMQDPTQFKSSELNFIAGTAVDKVAKKERWDKTSDESGKNWVEQFTSAFSKLQSGVKLSLEVVGPGHSRVETRVLTAIEASTVVDADVG